MTRGGDTTTLVLVVVVGLFELFVQDWKLEYVGYLGEMERGENREGEVGRVELCWVVCFRLAPSP